MSPSWPTFDSVRCGVKTSFCKLNSLASTYDSGGLDRMQPQIWLEQNKDLKLNKKGDTGIGLNYLRWCFSVNIKNIPSSLFSGLCVSAVKVNKTQYWTDGNSAQTRSETSGQTRILSPNLNEWIISDIVVILNRLKSSCLPVRHTPLWFHKSTGTSQVTWGKPLQWPRSPEWGPRGKLGLSWSLVVLALDSSKQTGLRVQL